MAGPLSAPQGARRDPRDLRKEGPHGRCQDRERCAGPGCRVSSGKTRYKRDNLRTEKERARLNKIMDDAGFPAEQENAA